MITILLYRLSFVQLGAALRKKTQPIEIYGMQFKLSESCLKVVRLGFKSLPNPFLKP